MNCFYHEVDQIVFIDQILQVGRERHWCISVYLYETGTHGTIRSILLTAVKSDRLLAVDD